MTANNISAAAAAVNNNKWPLDELWANRYETQLATITGCRSGGADVTVAKKFTSLRQLLATVRTATDSELSDNEFNVYGIIDAVNGHNELHRKVHIMDPSVAVPVTVVINNITAYTNIGVKNIIRLTDISIVSSSSSSASKDFVVNERRNFAQFYAFTYDYEPPTTTTTTTVTNNFNIFAANTHTAYQSDKLVAKLLEEWFAQTFIARNRLDKLLIDPSSATTTTEAAAAVTTSTDTTSNNNNSNSISIRYVDFACRVIASQVMKQSIQLTVSDGTRPDVNVHNQYGSADIQQLNCGGGITDGDQQQQQQQQPVASNRFHRLNTDAVLSGGGLDARRLVYVNIWKNSSNQHNDHYNCAESLTLLNGDDLVIIFNVEVFRSVDDQRQVKLHLRSGRHYGKGIRKVSRLSVLGRQLMKVIKQRERTGDYNQQQQQQQQQQELSYDEVMDTTISTNRLRYRRQKVGHVVVGGGGGGSGSGSGVRHSTPKTPKQITTTTTTASTNRTVCQLVSDLPVINELLALGYRHVQALYRQQLVEQLYPRIERTDGDDDYKYNVKTIEEVLDRMRQEWCRLPPIPTDMIAYQSMDRCIKIKDLLLTPDDDVDQLFVIRAKILDIRPKSVFPTDQFVLLKCMVCPYVATVCRHTRQYERDLWSQRQLLECPDCRNDSEKISQLIHLFAISFLISDAEDDDNDVNNQLNVCLTKDSAVSVFGGVRPERLLIAADNDAAAIGVDNTLFAICQMSDQNNGIDWVIRKTRSGGGGGGGGVDGGRPDNKTVHQVIALAPIHTFPL
ncbi:uncharacterized protein LOC128954238 [Oppia nitens]|uniref:uncharacterized protein LOC128954238 n=1 Tax=Oppia nitens TaxID=1686743 RepID=UPI0023DA3334|nr:uncharacterized protein LOC128954238 [Oppia nitens]